jgi:hypothetical protein
MPVEVDYVEQGIIHVHWLDVVNIPEVDAATNDCARLADEHEDHRYIEIVDLTRCSKIPFDVAALLRIAKIDKRIVGYVVVQPSHTARVMANMIIKLSKMPFRLVNTLPEAVPAGRDILDSTKHKEPQTE